MKECSNCFQVKSDTEFNKRFKSKDGLQFICKPCQSEANKRKYLLDREFQIKKETKRDLQLKGIKKRLSRAIKNKSNCLIDYIGIPIDQLIEVCSNLGFSHNDYGKSWGLFLKEGSSIFKDKLNSIHHSNLEPRLI